MSFLTKLQEKSYETRVKILWGAVIGVGIILVVVWVLSLKTTFSKIDGAKLINIDSTATAGTKESVILYASVERVERADNSLKIYFNFTNSADDILNISKLTDITLMAKDLEIKPQKITDRQGRAFVQKILSRTQNFGILTFPATNAALATLKFDQMYLEKNSADIFMQTLELNLDELSKNGSVRN